MILRRAGVDDAERVASIAAATFLATFAEQNRPEDIQAYARAAFSLSKIAAELADERAAWLLATVDGEDAAYAKVVGSSVPTSVDPPALELERFYVAARWQGKGVARDLMAGALEQAARLGAMDAPAVWLGVWEHNPRAISFYRKWSFEVVGAKPFVIGTEVQTDLIMQRRTGRDVIDKHVIRMV